VVGSGLPGLCLDSETFRWTSGGGVVGLGYLPGGNQSNAYGVSDNDSVVVGSSSTSAGVEAFRWTAGAGMVGLGDLAGGDVGSEALAVSRDGSIVVGYGDSGSDEAFIWDAVHGMQGLAFLPGHSGSTAYGVSADGKTVVGLSSSDVDLQAFRWTASGGMTSLGELPGNDPDLVLSVAYDTTAHGEVVVGYGEIAVPGGYETRAFIWDAAHHAPARSGARERLRPRPHRLDALRGDRDLRRRRRGHRLRAQPLR